VSVLPETTALASDELSVTSSRGSRAGAGSWARAVHDESLQVVEAQNELDESTSRELVRRLLAAVVKANEPHPDDETVVRVYYLDGQQEVRDVRANVRTSRLDVVLSGDLSELFSEEAGNRA